MIFDVYVIFDVVKEVLMQIPFFMVLGSPEDRGRRLL
jgi:hypothetical protein